MLVEYRLSTDTQPLCCRPQQALPRPGDLFPVRWPNGMTQLCYVTTVQGPPLVVDQGQEYYSLTDAPQEVWVVWLRGVAEEGEP
jgi:hypothetical protein